MATEHSVWIGALFASAPAVAAGAVASSFQVPTTDYAIATEFALIGIVARHCWDAYEALKADRLSLLFMLKALAIDIPTAPMLGILAYIFAAAIGAADLWMQGIIIAVGFAGPVPVRAAILTLMDAAVARVKNSGDKP